MIESGSGCHDSYSQATNANIGETLFARLWPPSGTLALAVDGFLVYYRRRGLSGDQSVAESNGNLAVTVNVQPGERLRCLPISSRKWGQGCGSSPCGRLVRLVKRSVFTARTLIGYASGKTRAFTMTSPGEFWLADIPYTDQSRLEAKARIGVVAGCGRRRSRRCHFGSSTFCNGHFACRLEGFWAESSLDRASYRGSIVWSNRCRSANSGSYRRRCPASQGRLATIRQTPILDVAVGKLSLRSDLCRNLEKELRFRALWPGSARLWCRESSAARATNSPARPFRMIESKHDPHQFSE